MGMKKGNLTLFLPSDLNVILKNLEKDCESLFNREVEIEKKIFKETIIVMPSLKTVRIYAHDITERERSGETLRESEARLKEAQRLAHVGSWDWDAITETIRCSDECFRMFNFDPQAPPQSYQDHLKVYSADSALRLDVAVKRAMQTGEPYELELEIADQISPMRWILARGETKRDANGRIMGLCGTTQDITELRLREKELSSKSKALEELNMALKVLIDHYKNDQIELEESIVSNIRVRIIPYIEKLKGSGLNIGQSTLLEIIERNFDDISSPFLKLISSKHFRFTPKEAEIVSLIKDGKATKEIAQILGIGKRTVDSYRDNIRDKLGLANKKVNLRTYILSLKNT